MPSYERKMYILTIAIVWIFNSSTIVFFTLFSLSLNTSHGLDHIPHGTGPA